jgi:hypothetical protein
MTPQTSPIEARSFSAARIGSSRFAFIAAPQAKLALRRSPAQA